MVSLIDMTNEDLVHTVIEGLSIMILRHSKMVASEQYNPSRTADNSDDYIKEHTEWVQQLRDIREQVENLSTGLIERNN